MKRFEVMEETSENSFPFESTSKSFWILNYKSWKKIKFEFGLNFKGVQTFEEKYHKFIKILT
jgi:hypothetical protein